VYVR